ncbi:MAG: ribosome-associated translation inhibitor RaiA [Nitrospirota bacterium]|jgi:putative sigma-54 modulation protein
MNLSILARHMELTDGLKTHVEERFGKLSRFLDDLTRLNVTLAVERNTQIADVVAKGPHALFQARESSADMYTSIDRAAAKLEKQLRRNHDKRTHEKTRGPKIGSPDVVAEEPTVPEALLDSLDRVVETREINVQRLRDYEAIRLMEDQDEHLWVYRDAESDRLRILARQSDDHLQRFDLVDD